LNQMIAKAMGESLRDVSRQASQLTRLCFSAEKEIGRKFKTLRRSVGSQQKKLVRSVDRMERDFKADERDFQRYGERFSEETAKGEQKIEKVTRGMNDRAERTETELALYGNDYTAKGEMRINQTLPRAIKSTDRMIDSAMKTFDNGVKQEARANVRDVKQLEREIDKEIKDTQRNASMAKNEATRMFDGALRGFDRNVKELSRGDATHTIAMNKAMRDAERTVERIGDAVEREEKDSESALERMDTSLE
ncbi:hypothetical protein FOZ63_016749, partial [Perkinsus olseni]